MQSTILGFYRLCKNLKFKKIISNSQNLLCFVFETKELYFGEVQSLGPRRIELRSCWLPARHFVISAVQPLQAVNFKLPIKCSSIVFNLENLFRFHCLINVFLKKFFKNMKKIRNRILDLIHTVLTCGGRAKMSGHWVSRKWVDTVGDVRKWVDTESRENEWTLSKAVWIKSKIMFLTIFGKLF